jgi:hypothetical protein
MMKKKSSKHIEEKIMTVQFDERLEEFKIMKDS